MKNLRFYLISVEVIFFLISYKLFTLIPDVIVVVRHMSNKRELCEKLYKALLLTDCKRPS